MSKNVVTNAFIINNFFYRVNFSGAHIQHLTIAMNDLVSNGANIKGSSRVDRPSVSHFDVQLQNGLFFKQVL